MKRQLRDAGQLTRQNQTGRAADERKAAAANLEKMLNALEEQKADDNDRLTRKLKDADKQLDELIDKQERLQKKAEAAEQIQDGRKKAAELEKLAREQDKLAAEARDLAQPQPRSGRTRRRRAAPGSARNATCPRSTRFR